jgi:hypothetical protein
MLIMMTMINEGGEDEEEVGDAEEVGGLELPVAPCSGVKQEDEKTDGEDSCASQKKSNTSKGRDDPGIQVAAAVVGDVLLLSLLLLLVRSLFACSAYRLVGHLDKEAFMNASNGAFESPHRPLDATMWASCCTTTNASDVSTTLKYCVRTGCALLTSIAATLRSMVAHATNSHAMDPWKH